MFLNNLDKKNTSMVYCTYKYTYTNIKYYYHSIYDNINVWSKLINAMFQIIFCMIYTTAIYRGR